jgi:hypothetical protein
VNPENPPPKPPGAFSGAARVTPGRALLLALCASLALAALVPVPALAASTRQLDTQLTGQTPPSAPVPGPFGHNLEAFAFDADNDLWLDSEVPPVVVAYNSAGGYLAEQTGDGKFGERLGRGLAFDESTGSLAVSNAPSGAIDVFDEAGEFLLEIPAGLHNNGELRVAIDNSGGPTQGRVYTADNVTGIHAYSPAGVELTPAEFTPEGGASGRYVAVDSHGDVYFTSEGGTAVREFRPSGEFVREFTGAGAPAPFEAYGVAEDPTTGNVLIDTGRAVDEFSSLGAYLGQIEGPSPGVTFGQLTGNIAVNSAGYLYVGESDRIDEFLPVGVSIPEAAVEAPAEVKRTTAELRATAELAAGEEVTACRFEYIASSEYHLYRGEDVRYAGSTAGAAPCLDEAGEEVGTPEHPLKATAQLHAPTTLTAGTTYHYRLSLANAEHPAIPRYSADETLETSPAVPQLKTQPASEITNHGAVLNASFLGEEALPVEYFFEYGATAAYGHKSGVATYPGDPSGSQPQNVGIEVEGLLPGATYHYRVIATNEYGTTVGEDLTGTTFQGPTIEGVSSFHLTSTSADLEAKIDPQGFATTYSFSYGPTTAYGQTAPEPAGEITTELAEPHSVKVEVTGLQPGVTYHFRLTAENRWEAATSEDQSFEFFPPACPNAAVRQQTGSAYLPDCRAYELVSPANANATLLYPGGPATGQATSPSRFAFVGDYSSLPGTDTIETAGDLYLATRTDTGWVSRYVGLPGDQAGCMGGPPTDPTSISNKEPTWLTDTVLANPSMSQLLSWDDGTPRGCTGTPFQESGYSLSPASNAPYLWDADGTLSQHLPTDLDALPGAEAALQCPYGGHFSVVGQCSGETTASPDLTHLIFSSNQLDFAESGLTEAPGSAYDDDLATGRVSLISKLPDCDPIPQDPAYAASVVPECGVSNRNRRPCPSEEYLRFPAVSADGSHVLISTATRSSECDQEQNTEHQPQGCPRFSELPLHLYMRIGGGLGVTYEIAEDKATGQPAVVEYVGMTEDGSEVFFTSEEHLTGEDEAHSGASLYMWSAARAEAGEQPLTLISKAAPGSPAGAGDTGECSPSLATVHLTTVGEVPPAESPWTTACGVRPISTYPYSALPAGTGGNGLTDSAIASRSGDIYFYSPEQLDGDRGVPGRPNLYDYREGQLRFVAALSPERTCVPGFKGPPICVEGPIVRMQVTPDGSHMAFLTRSRLTSYDNAGHLEMYSYTPSTETLLCDSCNPSGRPATADVEASQDGLFLTEDGRVFFSTAESLVPADTNEGSDVYEYVDGRPKLITPGTGTATAPGSREAAGLVAVSANGTDVYFSTFDTLLSEDHNGDFLKFYDARVDGGFPQPTPTQPCAAAEECHGPGTEAPVLPTAGAAAALAGGNASPGHHKKAAKRKKHHKKHKKVKHPKAKKHTKADQQHKKSKRHQRRSNHKHGGAK